MKAPGQRQSHRIPFVVTAEVTDAHSRIAIARLRNLNLYGCYVEMSNPLPENASLTIKVSAGKRLFQARGIVIYSDRNARSRVEFQGVEPQYQTVLEHWLLEASVINPIG